MQLAFRAVLSTVSVTRRLRATDQLAASLSEVLLEDED
jgi:hypothetical protein